MGKQPLTALHRAIVDVLTKNPEGVNIHQIRNLLKLGGTQQHLDKRVRELYQHYIIERIRKGQFTVYVLVGPRPKGTWDFDKVSKTLQAKILHRDGYRCQMCGRTVAEDKVRLHIDHKIPRDWGGKSDEPNLWTLCSTCNEGKKNYFASFDPQLMQQVLAHKSVHKRIAQLLSLRKGTWVDSDLIEFVANFEAYQQDWQKRLRELRYFEWRIEHKNEKRERRTVSFYRLVSGATLPDDPTSAARRYERERAERNRNSRKRREA